jgi:hypothetical protein
VVAADAKDDFERAANGRTFQRNGWNWRWRKLATNVNGLALFTRRLNAPGQACRGFRRTGGCSPDGIREVSGDLDCQATIPNLMSGFCDCVDGRIGVGCTHSERTCADVCATGFWAR